MPARREDATQYLQTPCMSAGIRLQSLRIAPTAQDTFASISLSSCQQIAPQLAEHVQCACASKHSSSAFISWQLGLGPQCLHESNTDPGSALRKLMLASPRRPRPALTPPSGFRIPSRGFFHEFELACYGTEPAYHNYAMASLSGKIVSSDSTLQAAGVENEFGVS
jgi:hypothetical protein